MLNPRRYIILPITLLLLVLGLVSYLIAFYIDLRIGFLSFFIFAFLIVLFKLHIPLQKIIQEMKALITGKPYKRIMTGKRNEIGILAHFFNEVTRNLEKISTDVKSHERITKELNNAQNIQEEFLPKTMPNIEGLELVARTRPSSEIGGDTFGFFEKENKNLIYIGDATGHGIPSALIMVMFDVLLSTFVNLQNTLTEIVKNTNSFLKPHLQPSNFMTLLILEWLPKEKQMKWLGAGHEYIIRYNCATETLTSIPAGGIALGMLPDNSAMLKEDTLEITENDFIILFSDGIKDAKNILGIAYGLANLEKVIKSNANPEISAEKLFEKIALDVSHYMEGHIQEDDMTLIVIKRTDKKVGLSSQSNKW